MLLLLILFFVNLVHSEKIYEININKNHKFIKTVETNEKLRVNAKLEGDWHKGKCNASCSRKTNGVENTFNVDCLVNREMKGYTENAVLVGDFYVNVETNIDYSTSLFSEWQCKFNVIRGVNRTKSFDVNFTIDSRELRKQDTEDLCWKPISIIAILISIGEGVYLVYIWLKCKGYNISLKLTKDVLDSSQILMSPLPSPPPQLLPKIKKQVTRLQSSSSQRNTKNINLREIPPEQIEKAPRVEGYEVMTPRTPRSTRFPSIISTSSDTTYQEIPTPQNIYDNDVILFKPHAFEKLHIQTVKSESSKPEDCTGIQNFHHETEKTKTLPGPQIAPNVDALKRNASVVKTSATMTSSPPKLTTVPNNSGSSDDEWTIEPLESEEGIYKNVP